MHVFSFLSHTNRTDIQIIDSTFSWKVIYVYHAVISTRIEFTATCPPPSELHAKQKASK